MWQPIETAPLDGTPVLLWDGYLMQICRWDFTNLWERSKAWVYGEAHGEYNVMPEFDLATHWAPMPQPPQEIEAPDDPRRI